MLTLDESKANVEDASLLEARFSVLSENVPKLYATLIATVMFNLFLLRHAVSPAVLAPWALCLVALAVFRGIHWWKTGRSNRKLEHDELRRRLADTDRIGIGLLSVYASIGYFTIQSPDIVLRVVVAVSLWASAVGTAIYLSVLPRTATSAIISGTACLSAVFLLSGGEVLMTSTPMFIMISAALQLYIRNNFETFKTVVETKSVVESMRHDAVRLAMTDSLTGLPNRRAFDARLSMLVAGGRPFAVALVDLDGFKPVNDTYGHIAGDKTLVVVAHRLRNLGEQTFVVRLGGDEFALLLEDADRAEETVRRAANLLSAAYRIDNDVIRIGASCGLAYWRKPGDESLIIGNADTALYVAKEKACASKEQNQVDGRIEVFQAAA